MTTFHIIDQDHDLHIVDGDKFSVTDAGQLVISDGTTPRALFSAGSWIGVKEIPGAQ